jgi:hypothetical protein
MAFYVMNNKYYVSVKVDSWMGVRVCARVCGCAGVLVCGCAGGWVCVDCLYKESVGLIQVS